MYDLPGYLAMMHDPVRVPAYRSALEQSVRPGDVVLDLGSGSGILSFFALACSAAHVYAIDTNPLVDIVRQLAARHGLSRRLTVVEGDARVLDLPPADVIVSDLRGALPLYRDGIDVVDKIRRRCLKPGGRMLPLADDIFVAPVACPGAHALVAGWRARWADVDYATVTRQAAQTVQKHALRAEQLLAPGQVAFRLDYLAPARTLEGTLHIEFSRPGFWDGLGAWFEATLSPGVRFSTAPEGPPTVYCQAVLPLYETIAVQAGDRAVVRVRVYGVLEGPIWLWSVQLERAARLIAHEEHATPSGTPISAQDVKCRRPDYTPPAYQEAAVDREILNLVDGQRTTGEIARHMAACFPERFGRWEAALGRVGAVVSRYRRGAA